MSSSVHPDGGSDFYRGADGLVAQHQHLPRSALGPGPGDLWRGPVPHLAHRHGLRPPACRATTPNYYKTIATPKHFAVHSGPRTNRHREDVHPSPHDYADTYLPAFRATVMEAKVASVMCAYNAVNGVPACASTRPDAGQAAQGLGLYGLCGVGLRGHRPISTARTRCAI